MEWVIIVTLFIMSMLICIYVYLYTEAKKKIAKYEEEDRIRRNKAHKSNDN